MKCTRVRLGRAARRGRRGFAPRTEGQTAGERRCRSRCHLESGGDGRIGERRQGTEAVREAPRGTGVPRSCSPQPSTATTTSPAIRSWPQATNLPHREFVHRMAYEMGRTLIGYEVQKVLAAVDWFVPNDNQIARRGVPAYGEGGAVALYAAAVDARIRVRCRCPGISARAKPCTTNRSTATCGDSLREFGDAELAALIRPRRLESILIDNSPARAEHRRRKPLLVGVGRGRGKVKGEPLRSKRSTEWARPRTSEWKRSRTKWRVEPST